MGSFGVRRPRSVPGWWGIVALSSVLLLGACARAAPSGAVTKPGPRSGHNLVFDRDQGRTLLLFGYSGAALPARSEIWSWKEGRWSIVDRAGPGFRSLAGAAYDDARRALLVFGGAGPGYRSRYGDTWAWANGEWTEMVAAGPGPVDHHAVAYDELHDALIVFGGNTPTGGWPRATWALDSAGWRIVGDSSSGPSGRAHHAMVYDSARGRIVMFGGLGPDRSYLDDTWEWNGTRWHRVAQGGPPPRTRHRLAFDAARRVVVLYGGAGVNPPGRTSGFTVLSDTWEYEGGRGWRSVGGGAGPGLRMLHAMVYDASVGETLLFGGSDGTTNRDDLWGWNGARWIRK
jgi:Galactose oxidase, central domain